MCHVKHLVGRARLVKAVATSKRDKCRCVLANRLDAKILSVAAKEDGLVGWVISNSSSNVDRTVDQMPFELE